MYPAGRPNSTPAAVNRLTVVAAALLLWGVLIVLKLVSLQVSQHAKYLAMARRQQEQQIDIPAPRGSIFDRNGQPLAISVPVDSVSVNPLQIVDLRLASQALSNVLHVDSQGLLARLTWARQNKKGFMWVKRRVDPFEAEQLRALHLEWVTMVPESTRHYPKGETAAHVLGGVYKEEEGAAGIEKAFDTSLRGKAGSEHMVMDVRRRGIDSRVDSAPHTGDSLTLTIDERLQYIAERELKAGVEAKHARYGTAIVMDPYTGEILALANYPTYDPNKAPTPAENKWARFDLGVSVPFEPGSIFKVITLSAALETTSLTPDSLIPTGNGVLKLPGRVVHEAHNGYGTITMQQVLEKSSNIGAILIGAKVGRENMYEYAKRFGIGEKTGVGMPAESRGLLRTLDRWGTTSLASISMGQEVSTTSVQLARACSVIANGGLRITPKIVLKEGEKTTPTESGVRILKPETVMTMRMMMEGVVLRGTARNTARLDGYTSAGKTGTAQIFENGHYTHLYNASFMGFTPVTNPRLVIVVTLNGTEGNAGMGASAAAPVFKNIATEALRMYDIPKDIPEELNAAKKPAPHAEPIEDDLSIAGLGPSIMAEDNTVKELLAEQEKAQQKLAAKNTDDDGMPAQPPAPVLALARPNAATVPDFRGKSIRDVIQEASSEGIELTIEGSGVARVQLPPPGEPLRRGEKIRIVFAR
jgi:cell division protein FtsI (penicillin-binding protein 3)